jgi:hypothetical protein|tara:strand:- start:1331 stop:1531 length:201 start_codon:yes stop_codon:yes gene_type:complete
MDKGIAGAAGNRSTTAAASSSSYVIFAHVCVPLAQPLIDMNSPKSCDDFPQHGHDLTPSRKQGRFV